MIQLKHLYQNEIEIASDKCGGILIIQSLITDYFRKSSRMGLKVSIRCF